MRMYYEGNISKRLTLCSLGLSNPKKAIKKHSANRRFVPNNLPPLQRGAGGILSSCNPIPLHDVAEVSDFQPVLEISNRLVAEVSDFQPKKINIQENI